MSPEDRKKAAQLLLQAEKERKPVVQLSTTWPDITIGTPMRSRAW
jgi:hypothetical protein